MFFRRFCRKEEKTPLPLTVPVPTRRGLWIYGAFLAVLSVSLYYATHLVPYGVADYHPDTTTFSDHLLAIFSLQGLITTGFYVLLIDLFCRSKYWGGGIIYIPLLLYQLLRIYMYRYLSISDPADYVGVFLETDVNEAASYLTFYNIFLLVAFLFASLAIRYAGRRLLHCPKKASWKSRSLTFAEIAALTLLGYSVTFGAQNSLCKPYSSFLIAGLKTQQILRKGGVLSDLKKLPSPAEYPSRRRRAEGKTTIIFVVGESVRADHLQLAGYGRATTPLLQKRTERGELAFFPHTLSFDTATSKSVVGMLTNASNEARQPTAGSFIALFGKHGFHTSFMRNMPEATPTMKLLTSCCREIACFDSFLGEKIIDRLKEIHHAGEADRFIVIQTRGSHYHYPNKYPRDRYSMWKPDENYQDLSTDNPDLINSYDNSILYLDSFLDDIMTLFEDRQAVLVYSSDHGESFGEGGRFIHGGPLSAMEQRRVPLLIWASPSYRRHHAAVWAALLHNRSLSVQHGNLFHTVPSLAGISCALTDPQKDLTRQQPLTSANKEENAQSPAGRED